MYRVSNFARVAMLCCVTLLPEVVAGDTLQEMWYRMRSRDNMKIGNYEAAIEAYEKYLESKPNDREALKGIALAYEKQGDTDKAIARYDRYLELYQDDPEIAFKQANFLMWDRYSYRKKDAIKYFRMGLAETEAPRERLKLARLLAEDRYDLDAAVKQYEILLEQDPQNREIRREYRGIVLWDDRYLAKAIEQFEYHVEQNPNDFQARRQLAVLLGKTLRRKAEGVEIYEQLVKEKPGDRGLRRDYARLLSITPGKYQEARTQYRILIKQQPDNELLAEAAQHLEQRRENRPEALELYNRILERNPNATRIRMRRASIYMDDKATAPRALDDYQFVLRQDSKNADAHHGAAEALAWLGRPDDALYHANLARKYSKGGTSSAQLHSKLSEGREPRITTFLALPYQDGDENYKLRGVRIGAGVSGDISPYITAGLAAGHERFEHETDDESGGWWQLHGEYRASPQEKFNIQVENHGIREVGETQTYALSYTYSPRAPLWSHTFAYAGRLVNDSFLSLVGDKANDIGGAIRHEFYANFLRGGRERQFTLRPAVGWVESASEDDNEFIDLSGTMRFAFSSEEEFKTFYGVDAKLMAYANDHSGFAKSNSEPLSGGYFSPQKFISALVYADLVKSFGQAGELKAKLGPKIQLVDDATVSNETESGFYGSISYTHQRSESLFLTITAEYDEVGDVYNRTILQGQAVYLF